MSARARIVEDWPETPPDEYEMSDKDPNDLVTHAELRPVCDRLDRIEKKLDTLYEIWMQAQGGAKLARFVFYIIAPIVGAIWWLKDHIRW